MALFKKNAGSDKSAWSIFRKNTGPDKSVRGVSDALKRQFLVGFSIGMVMGIGVGRLLS